MHRPRRKAHQRVRSRRIGMDGTGHQGVDDLVRVRFRGMGGIGFHPTIILTQSRAVSLFVIPGKCRWNSTTADNSPLASYTWRTAAAVASSTLNMAQAWAAELQRTSNFADLTTYDHVNPKADPGREPVKPCRGRSLV